MTALKPCPHCGAVVEIFHGIASDFECAGCGATFRWTYGGIEEKISKFNRRVSPEVAEGLSALRSYGQHTSGCSASYDSCRPCECGFRAALARIEGVK